MKESAPNHYERAFENWLIENQVEYVPAAEQHKPVYEQSNLKSFDFLLCPASGKKIIAEVKGRRFKGTTFAGLSRLECWVTTEDVDGLAAWQKILGEDYDAMFFFAYKSQNVDVDFDGRDTFEYDNGRYLFFAVRLADYIKYMKQRSPKWKTVTLSAEKFRLCAKPVTALVSSV
ncbi:MAG: HYExAFE family protein [Sedimentisphaerales bacterium]|nr:HYExAFE family protein [Sedimentisphaerales bacterium]